MDRTYSRLAEVEADGDAAIGTGLYLDGSGQAAEGTVDFSRIEDPATGRPAGSSTWSTPSQMVLWADHLMNGDGPVADATIALMTTPQASMGYPDGIGSDYGYGLFIADYLPISDTETLPLTVWQHGGNTLSYTSALTMLPEHDFGISILASGYSANLNHTLATAITTLIDGLPPAEPVAEHTIDPAGLDRHVGEYLDPYNVGAATITREGDDLLIEMPYLDELGFSVTPELYGLATDLWYVSIDGAWYDLTFLGEGQPETQWLRNRAFVLQRLDTTLPQSALPQGPPALANDRRAVLNALRLGPASHDIFLPAGP
jgi:hypothetical protein